MSPTIKLTYFNIEAAAEPVRLALAVSNTPFEDHRVAFSEWPAMKPTLPGGQLPIMMIDKGPVMTQSKAMLRHIGATYSETLYPREKLYPIEEAIGIVEDLDRAFMIPKFVAMKASAMGYPADFAKTDEGKKVAKELREAFVANELPKYLDRLTKMIESHGGPFLVAGDHPTIADCIAVPLLRSFTIGFIDHVDTKCLDGHPVVVKYIKDFCALEHVKGRYSSGIH